MDDLSIAENGDKITLSETIEYDEKTLIEEYRKLVMDTRVYDKLIEVGPQRVYQIELQIQVMGQTIDTCNQKSARLTAIFEAVEMNIPKRIKKLREIYTDKEILQRTQKIVANAKTEIVEVDGKYEITTSTLNEVEDLLIEYMELESNKPGRLEAKLKEEKNLERAKESIEKTKILHEKNNERKNTIKEFFKKKGKDLDKLLDQEAQSRKKGKKVAEAL